MTDSELFRDPGERLRYRLTEREVERLLAEPHRVEAGRRHFRMRLRSELANPRALEAWEKLLEQPVSVICRRLLAFDEEARLLRATRPAFVVLSPSERADVAEACRADP